MRQAGRSLPEYRRVRTGISMLDSCRRPDLVTEITLQPVRRYGVDAAILYSDIVRSEEHTSELQSRQYLVCRLLLEKKKNSVMIAGIVLLGALDLPEVHLRNWLLSNETQPTASTKHQCYELSTRGLRHRIKATLLLG